MKATELYLVLQITALSSSVELYHARKQANHIQTGYERENNHPIQISLQLNFPIQAKKKTLSVVCSECILPHVTSLQQCHKMSPIRSG